MARIVRDSGASRHPAPAIAARDADLGAGGRPDGETATSSGVEKE